MNNVLKGYHRDKLILSLIEEYGALDTEQVAVLVFQGMKTGYRKAQQRLKKIYDMKKVKRNRLAFNCPYVYYIEKHGRLEHLIALNWVKIWFVQRLANWERLHWEPEQNYGMLQADAFAGIKNVITGAYKFYFIETDRGTNKFDKVEKYNALYESEKYINRWWVKHTTRFPAILCVTEGEQRLKHIQKYISENNRHNLEFHVRLLDDLRKEAMSWNMPQ